MMNREINPHIATYGRPVVNPGARERVEELKAELRLRQEQIAMLPSRDVESSTILGEEILDIEFEDDLYDHDGVMIDDMTLATTYRPVV